MIHSVNAHICKPVVAPYVETTSLLCYLWSLSSAHSTQFPLYQIMGYLTLTVKCSSRQHTAGSTFLGTYAIMIKSPWIRVPSTLNSWPSHCMLVRRHCVFPANYCTLLRSIYCSVPSASWQREVKSTEWARGPQHGLGAHLEGISHLWVELKHQREPKNIYLDKRCHTAVSV